MIQMLNSAGATWGEFFLLAVVQNTIFLGLVIAALHIFRNAPARVRYLIAFTGLVKLVLPPFLRIPSIMTIPEEGVGGYGSVIPFVNGSESGSVSTVISAGENLTAAGVFLGIWAIVVIAGLVLPVAASVRLALKLRKAGPVDPGDIPWISGIGNVRILRSDRIAMPITVAYLPGRIYVPMAWDEWTMSCRRMVLMHEKAHMQRHDGLVLIMQIIARAIYFFHPLVAILDRRLSEYREMACDDATVGGDRDSGVEYSRYLVEIAESIVRGPSVCGSASALIRRKNELLRRVSYQLEEGRMRSISKTRIMILMAAIVLLAVSLSWYRGEADTIDPQPAPPVQPDPAAHPAPVAPPSQENSKRAINVSLASDGAEVDGKSIDLSLLVEALKSVGGDDPENVMVRFVCADDVSMGQVRMFHEALGEAGIDKIRYGKSDGEGLTIQLPPREALDRLAEMPETMIIDVVVGKNGGVVVGARNVEIDELKGVIEKKLEETPVAIVVIHNDEATSYGDFTKVLALAKKAGAERIVVKYGKEE